MGQIELLNLLLVIMIIIICYLKLFGCVHGYAHVIWISLAMRTLSIFDREIWLIRLLMLDINTWNHMNVCEQMINIK